MSRIRKFSSISLALIVIVAAILATIPTAHGVINSELPISATGLLLLLLLALVVAKQLIGERDARQLVDFESTLLDNLSEGVVACDAAGEIVYANRAAHELQGIPTGIPLDRFVRERRLLDQDGNSTLEDEQTPLIRCLRGGDPIDERIKFVRDGGDVRDALCNAKRVVRPDGSIIGAVTAFRDITALVELSTELQRERERLAHLADHDELTGLFNRRVFEERLEEHLLLADRYGPEGALLMVDIDNLKEVNDTYGHAAGDALILAAAEAMGHRLRDSDLVFRVGGDEFAVLLPHADREQAIAAADGIMKSVRDNCAKVDVEMLAGTTASLGIAVIAEFDNPSEGTIKAAADAAMYQAKERGRNCRVVAVGRRAGQRSGQRSGNRAGQRSGRQAA